MRINKDNITKINFHGLVLVFSTSVSNLQNAGKLHTMECSVAKKAMNSKHGHVMDSGVIEDTLDLLDREYGVTLCKCAKGHQDVK